MVSPLRASFAAGDPSSLQFTVAKPPVIAGGELALEFDPSEFASIGNVTALSAAGDAYGFATSGGLHVDAHFRAGVARICSCRRPRTALSMEAKESQP